MGNCSYITHKSWCSSCSCLRCLTFPEVWLRLTLASTSPKRERLSLDSLTRLLECTYLLSYMDASPVSACLISSKNQEMVSVILHEDWKQGETASLAKSETHKKYLAPLLKPRNISHLFNPFKELKCKTDNLQFTGGLWPGLFLWVLWLPRVPASSQRCNMVISEDFVFLAQN